MRYPVNARAWIRYVAQIPKIPIVNTFQVSIALKVNENPHTSNPMPVCIVLLMRSVLVWFKGQTESCKPVLLQNHELRTGLYAKRHLEPNQTIKPNCWHLYNCSKCKADQSAARVRVAPWQKALFIILDGGWLYSTAFTRLRINKPIGWMVLLSANGLFRTSKSLQGWRVREVCLMLLFVTKKHGFADIVLRKLLAIMDL